MGNEGATSSSNLLKKVFQIDMCDTQQVSCGIATAGTDTGDGEGGVGISPSFAASPSRTSPAGRAARPKHPYGRRNTYIGAYTRHALGFATADRDENLLTTKFRNLPSRERRLYTLTLGYGLRDDVKSGLSGGGNKLQRPEMSRGHAVALMARLHEMLLHGGRTVEGIFSALGLDTRCIHEVHYQGGFMLKCSIVVCHAVLIIYANRVDNICEQGCSGVTTS